MSTYLKIVTKNRLVTSSKIFCWNFFIRGRKGLAMLVPSPSLASKIRLFSSNLFTPTFKSRWLLHPPSSPIFFPHKRLYIVRNVSHATYRIHHVNPEIIADFRTVASNPRLEQHHHGEYRQTRRNAEDRERKRQDRLRGPPVRWGAEDPEGRRKFGGRAANHAEKRGQDQTEGRVRQGFAGKSDGSLEIM